MPLVEKMSNESELRAAIAHLNWVIQRNPLAAKDLGSRRQAVQTELNNLLLSQEGYEVVKVADVQKAAYAAGHAAAKAEMEDALK
jgi:hypothetical protein